MEPLSLLSGLAGGGKAPAGGMRWVQCGATEFKGELPPPRSGHSASLMSRGRLVVFGGLVDKRFLGDLHVLDLATSTWTSPPCTGSQSEGGAVGPGPRAFHVAVALECHLFVFGGRSGQQRLGDLWMLDTDSWQWVDLSAYGHQPPPRDFAAAAPLPNGKLVLCGGWDGSKWLADAWMLDTASLEWRQLSVPGSSPVARCGHSATMVERRLLVLGGRGAAGGIFGDLWALKGVVGEESPAWTNLRLPGVGPSARCGHSATSAGSVVVVFGGHGATGWLTRTDLYLNDTTLLDRASVQWRKLGGATQPPPPRAYHTLTRVNDRKLVLVGGFNGKSTFGDLWWLLTDEDPPSHRSLPQTAPSDELEGQEAQVVGRLRERMGLPPHPPSASPRAPLGAATGLEDAELVHLGLRVLRTDRGVGGGSAAEAVECGRRHLHTCPPSALHLRDLRAMLADYQRLVGGSSHGAHHAFFHYTTANEMRLKEVPLLQEEYRKLVASLPHARG